MLQLFFYFIYVCFVSFVVVLIKLVSKAEKEIRNTDIFFLEFGKIEPVFSDH